MTAQEEIRKDAEIQDECVKPEKKKVAKNSEYISLIGRDEKDEIVPSVSIEEQADSNIRYGNKGSHMIYNGTKG